MEKILSRLKTNSWVSLILGVLSLTWVVIDYFVIKEILRQYQIVLSFETILLIISAIAAVIFHISVFITLYYVMRFVLKYKSALKTADAAKQAASTPAEK